MAGKGGARPGAGRKPKAIKDVIKPLDAALLLSNINAESKFGKLANSKDEKIQLDTLKYLTDRAYGKAQQTIMHGNTTDAAERAKAILARAGLGASTETESAGKPN